MDKFQHLLETHSCLFSLIIILILWDTVWKAIAMWKSARNNHLVWFLCITIINSIGILPIIYILTHRKQTTE